MNIDKEERYKKEIQQSTQIILKTLKKFDNIDTQSKLHNIINEEVLSLVTIHFRV